MGYSDVKIDGLTYCSKRNENILQFCLFLLVPAEISGTDHKHPP